MVNSNQVTPSFKYIVFNGVYEPSDDTFLLLSALEKVDVKGKYILELGCGCGIISLYLAYRGGIVEAVDIDENAVENTIYNANLNDLKIKVYRSDLFKSVDRSKKFNIIVFNPPYLEDELNDVSIVGGTELILKFLDEVPRYLKKRGEIYFIINDKNDYGLMYITAYLNNIYLSIILEKKLFFESIFVVRGVKIA